MSTDISIYSKSELCIGRQALEDELADLLGGYGEVTGGGVGDRGWHVDIEIFEESLTDQILGKIIALLCEQQGPPDTYLMVNGRRLTVNQL